MPVYDFVCLVCGEHFEARRPFSDSSVEIACPRGHKQARRVFSTPSVVFKGSGFYVTDHRKPAAAGSEK